MLSDNIFFCCCRGESSHCSPMFFWMWVLNWVRTCLVLLLFIYANDCFPKTKRHRRVPFQPFCPRRHRLYLVSGDYVVQKAVRDASHPESLLALVCRELACISRKASGPVFWSCRLLLETLWAWFSSEWLPPARSDLEEVAVAVGEADRALHVLPFLWGG